MIRLKNFNGDVTDVLTDLSHDYQNSNLIDMYAKEQFDSVSGNLSEIQVDFSKLLVNKSLGKRLKIKKLVNDICRRMDKVVKAFDRLNKSIADISDSTVDDFAYVQNDYKGFVKVRQ